jgi:hypothetical protein
MLGRRTFANWCVGCAGWLLLVPAAWAIDYVTINRDGEEREIAGKIEVEAVDGGVLLLSQDGELWPITAEELVARRSDDQPFESLTREAMNSRLLKEHPGFKLHQTAHYTLCYNTSPAYAQWVGSLYERLHDGFYNYWTKRGLKLRDSELPMVAVVFDTRENYALFAQRDLGEAVGGIIGYYSLRSNQVIMYDLTGLESVADKRRGANTARINALLSQPAAERNVATIVHEATHQLVFNSGMQTRYADIPFWVSEGLAVYFETPDLTSAKGWKKIGGVNRYNLLLFRRWLRERPESFLEQLLVDDKRFRDPATAQQAYSEAWALNYYLLRTRSDEYTAYLQQLTELKPLVALEPQQRIAMFKAAFGGDIAKFEADFLKYMRNVD